VPRARKFDNWLKGLALYVEETEAPRQFWFWSGIFTLAAALQRKVWLPYGFEPVYPNLYILLIADPGTKKGAPIAFAKRCLEMLQSPVSVDSSSKRSLTQELAQLGKGCYFTYNTKTMAQSPMAVISKEMSSLLAVNPKEMIEVLTDLYDPHDIWHYKTSGKGEDKIISPCVSCFIATTPTWFARNLPEEAIGGGYTSRHIIIGGKEEYKPVAIPPVPDEQLFNDLIYDLATISHLTGVFKWEKGAEDFFTKWYNDFSRRKKFIKDERLAGFGNRIHIMILKTTMALRVAYSNELTLTIEDLGKSIDLLEQILIQAPEALGGHGRNLLSADTQRIQGMIRGMKKISFSELLVVNRYNVNKTQLEEILENLQAMNLIRIVNSVDEGKVWIHWVDRKEKT
jgi:hypothetical protein